MDQNIKMSQQRGDIRFSFTGDVCHLELVINQAWSGNRPPGCGRLVENIRNCDVFVDDTNFYFYADVKLFKFHSQRRLDVKDLKHLIIKYNSSETCYRIELPCLPIATNGNESEEFCPEKRDREKCYIFRRPEERNSHLWKLKRITDTCRLQVDNSVDLQTFQADFHYGFDRKYKGLIHYGQSDKSQLCRVLEPHLTSPLKRMIDRHNDELKDFSPEQYKLNFVDLQIPEGSENPMKYTNNLNVVTLTKEEECLLHNITMKAVDPKQMNIIDQPEVDCALVDILLGICYDIRSTADEITCESYWTRSILSSTLIYLQPFRSLKDVVIAFLRRSLIYPLYRNYDFGRLCVQDAIDILQWCPKWLLKQLLVSHLLFLLNGEPTVVSNRIYIEHYIRCVHNEIVTSSTHLQMLSRNLKNVLIDVTKKDLQLHLIDIETELLKELIRDIHTQQTQMVVTEGGVVQCDGTDSSGNDGEFVEGDDNYDNDNNDDDDDDDDDDEEDDDDDEDDDGNGNDNNEDANDDDEDGDYEDEEDVSVDHENFNNDDVSEIIARDNDNNEIYNGRGGGGRLYGNDSEDSGNNGDYSDTSDDGEDCKSCDAEFGRLKPRIVAVPVDSSEEEENVGEGGTGDGSDEEEEQNDDDEDEGEAEHNEQDDVSDDNVDQDGGDDDGTGEYDNDSESGSGSEGEWDGGSENEWEDGSEEWKDESGDGSTGAIASSVIS